VGIAGVEVTMPDPGGLRAGREYLRQRERLRVVGHHDVIVSNHTDVSLGVGEPGLALSLAPADVESGESLVQC
jgi:hypothetical protein